MLLLLCLCCLRSHCLLWQLPLLLGRWCCLLWWLWLLLCVWATGSVAR